MRKNCLTPAVLFSRLGEAAAWRGSLERKPLNAKKFYAVLASDNGRLGHPFCRLLWSAVVTGCLRPPLTLLILLLTSDRHVMSNRINSPLERIAG